MSLIQRKPRPLKRGDATFRDDRLFLVACDDTFAPKQYFDSFQMPRVKIHVVPTEDGTSAAPHVLGRLDSFEHEEDDERWMLLDTDHCTQNNHLPTFLAAIDEARKKGIKTALSKPCFEVWLLLHHVDEAVVKGLQTAAEVEKKLRETLGSYNKTRLDLGKFPLQAVAEACFRAKRLDQDVPGGDNPAGVTTRVYQLWESVVAKALASQIPVELEGLVAQR